MSKLKKILDKEKLTKKDMKYIFELENKKDLKYLYDYAYEVKKKYVGKKAYFRGIIEFSNICEKDCLYCGIRKSNSKMNRYIMSENEILEKAKWAYENGYGSLVLQSGERHDKEFIDFVENILKKIKEISNNALGITLSLGEQQYDTYKKWYDAGAHRYLLRIETSNKKLYKKLHPSSHNFDTRFNCLKHLKDIGYQVGTGVMVGLPFQTTEDMINDVLFYKDFNIDMVGMGPYLKHNDTPLAREVKNYSEKKQLKLGLKIIAITRILLQDINIAATTALQALNPVGRELGLKAGANVVMPNITDKKYREFYKLYENKPCTDEKSTECKSCLKNRVESIGENVGFNEWGDSPHYFKRISQSKNK